HEQQDPTCVPALRQVLRHSQLPQARLLALWSLAGLNALDEADLLHTLADSSPHLRAHAVRLAEPRLDVAATLRAKVVKMVDDPDERVCFQLAFSLGETDDLV